MFLKESAFGTPEHNADAWAKRVPRLRRRSLNAGRSGNPRGGNKDRTVVTAAPCSLWATLPAHCGLPIDGMLAGFRLQTVVEVSFWAKTEKTVPEEVFFLFIALCISLWLIQLATEWIDRRRDSRRIGEGQ
jgi:hypothetical protein